MYNWIPWPAYATSISVMVFITLGVTEQNIVNGMLILYVWIASNLTPYISTTFGEIFFK